PKNLLYTESHEWVQKTDEGTVRVGITDYAQSELGDIVFINLPGVGNTVAQSEVFADVESVKAVSDILSPVAGVVSAVNEALMDEPQQMNESPYEAWIAELTEVGDFGGLMDADAYAQICGQ
ncbi:MAG: glycine cleavage system protein GcvH, partial [Oscillospiraceae bacterium]|nr:glycine cleavage system protein GcvH [Oscillospiraceae bacterium]